MNRMIPRLVMLGLAGSLAATALILGGEVSAGPTTSAPPAPAASAPTASAPTASVPTTPSPVWGQATGGLWISATASKDHFACGEPVILSVIEQNVGAEDTSIECGGIQETDFWITVVDQTGKAMPLTRFGSRLNPLAASETEMPRLAGWRVHPGGEHKWTLVPSRVADMTFLGRYTITVSRDIAVKGIHSQVVSNPVVVSVDDWYLPGTSPQVADPRR
jgi:hypothetical protein